MYNKLFGGKKRNSAAEGSSNPSLGRHDRPKYASFCMPERPDNPPLGCHSAPKSVSFSVPEWTDNPPRGHCSSTPPKSTSFSMPEWSDNAPLGCHGLLKPVSFSVPEWSDNPPLLHHDPPRCASFSMSGRLDNPSLRHHGPPESASSSVPGLSEDPPLRHGPPGSSSYSVPRRSDNPRPGRRHGPPKSVSFSVPRRSSSAAALKIIHAGGIAEYYYMATPAARILEKYPSFILARPDVFRRPWDSVIHKDEILIPGQKYYVVPECTIKKLRRRIKKNSGIIINTNNLSFISQSSQDSSKKAQQHTSIIKSKSSSDHKNKARNRRVRFFGIDCKQDYSSCSISLEMISKENEKEDHGKILNDPQRICRARNILTIWQPTLTVINEK